MKHLLNYIIFLSLISSYAQVSPLLDHDWQLDKIVTADSTLVLPDNIITTTKFENDIYLFGDCITFGSNISTYNDISQSFQLSQGGVPISPECNPELFLIDEFYVEEFIYDQPFISFLNPFFYTFTTQNNKIYLDITNSEGSVATFFVNLLSQEEFKKNLIIYPNPVKDKLFIESPNIALEQVNIYDLSGKMVFKQKDLSNDNLDVSHLQSGVYILKIKTPVGVVQRKLVKD